MVENYNFTIKDSLQLECRKQIINGVEFFIKWLIIYTSKVEPIANADANRTTRKEAFLNIILSGLMPQKLGRSDKGNPETPVITASYVGDGIIEIEITNGKEFDPSSITIIAIEVPPVTDPATKKPILKILYQ